ncbi:MAG TPA: hypothetical protein VM031_01475, partial [Phycisphaerae bacterium]|nr:hypothetical protein [Phycisphaerae bacterium]
MLDSRKTTLAGSFLVALAAVAVASAADAPKTPPIVLGAGVRIENAETPFEYFANPWTVIGLKDYTDGTRITPNGELVLAGGLLCRPLIGKAMVPLNRRVTKVLRKGALPIVRFDFLVNGTVRYTIEALACPLEGPWQARYDRPGEGNFLNLVRVTFTNRKDAPAEAAFGLEWRRAGGKLKCLVKESSSKKAMSVFSGKTELCRLDVSDRARVTAGDSRVEVAVPLAGGASAALVARIPFRPVGGAEAEAFEATSRVSFDTWAERTESFWEGLLRRGAGVVVPEAKPMDVYRASLVYQFIGRDKGDLRAGEGFYDGLYLRDGAYQAISLAHAGYLDEAKESLTHFLRFQGKDGFFCTQGGQLDGHGYAMWALVEYYRLSHDVAWLRRVYPQVVKAVTWIRGARRKEKDPASPFAGILPAAPADGENLWDGKHHIIGYDWWSLRGLQAAADAARSLGKDSDAAAFDKEFQDFRKSILRALERTNLPYIPPSYEKVGTHWGNLEAIFPSLLIDPNDRRLTATLDFVRNRFGAVGEDGGGFIEGVIQWSPPGSGAIHPYMSQFVTNSHIIRGEVDKAVDGFYSFLLHTTSTQGFPEGVHYRRRAAWGNTVPHLWAAALYVTTLRNMLVREQGEALHLLSAVPVGWLDEGKRIRVTGAPTHFGKASLLVEAEKDVLRVRLTPPARNAAGRLVLHLPKGIEATAAQADGAARPLRLADPRTVILAGELARKPSVVTVRIRRGKGVKGVTFATKVAAYLAEQAERFRPIPHVVPPPGKIDPRKCVKLDLSRLANTNPLTAPFNVPSPGKYLFTGLPVGDRTVRGVPFHVLDPAKNRGKGLVVLHGA